MNYKEEVMKTILAICKEIKVSLERGAYEDTLSLAHAAAQLAEIIPYLRKPY